MKKKILLAILTLVLACAAVLCVSAETPKVIQPGDVNGDGDINAVDMVLLSQYIAGWDVVLGGDSHTVVIDPAVPATCTQTGLTEGKHCSDCGMILVKQQVIPTKHEMEESFVQPTTTTQGYTLLKCKLCGYEEKSNFIPPVNSNGLAVEVNTTNMTCVITGIGDCPDTDINIPSKISDYTVVGIADKAFADQTQITSITIPNTVKTLGQRAFYGCTGLTEFTVPASVTSVGHQVFYKCDNLATVYYNSSFAPDQDKVFLNIPSIKTVVFGGKFIPNTICYKCSNIETVIILDSVKGINYGGYYDTSVGSFSGCTNLKELTVGSGLTYIGEYMFFGCKSLSNVIIPDSVTSIGYYSFSGCSALTSVTIGNRVTDIYQNAFFNCGNLQKLHIDNLETWLDLCLGNRDAHPFCSSENGELYINGTLATDIEIPDSIANIGFYAFYNCDSLTNVQIPDSVTNIGRYAFSSCGNLASVSIPDSMMTIGERAFSGCYSLKDMVIPESVLNIDSGAFGGCKSLKSITIPNSITSISSYLFSGCSGLERVTIPNSVTSIGYDSFYGCSKLTNLCIDDLESWLNIDWTICDDFDGEYVSHPLRSAGGNLYINGVLATEITIPDGIKTITGYSFYNCDSIITVTIPEGVENIGEVAFCACNNLKKVNISDGVNTISRSAFASCTSLESVTIPSSVENIDAWGFYNCGNLKDLYINDLASWLNINLGNSQSHPLNNGGGNLYIDGVLATDIKIPDSVTSIGGYAFYNCSSLTSVEIPDSVTSIGYAAFSSCSSLTSVYYGGSAEDWAAISIDNSYGNNSDLLSATIYYYSATQPTTTGNYWHYVDGKPTPW